MIYSRVNIRRKYKPIICNLKRKEIHKNIITNIDFENVLRDTLTIEEEKEFQKNKKAKNITQKIHKGNA